MVSSIRTSGVKVPVIFNNYINAVPDPKTHHLHLFIVMAVMAAFLLPIICYWLRNTKEYSFGTYIEQLIATYIGYIVFMALPFCIVLAPILNSL